MPLIRKNFCRNWFRHSPKKKAPLFASRLVELEDRTAPAYFDVTNLNDSGVGSLRWAVQQANANPNDLVEDSVRIMVSGTIKLTSGQINITDGIWIYASAVEPTKVTISGNNTSRIFDASAAGAVQIRLSGLTLTKGNAGVGNGGAIRVSGQHLSVSRVQFIDNFAANGGAISGNKLSTFDIFSCQFKNNSALGNGGAVNLDYTAKAQLFNVHFTGNTASGSGGAIQIDGIPAGGHVAIKQGTLYGNSASGNGGAINMPPVNQFADKLPHLFILETTLASNTANGSGGAIAAGYVKLHLGGSTVIGNKAVTGSGGGVAINEMSNVQFFSSVISDNSNTSAPDYWGKGALFGTVVDYTVIGSPTGTDIPVIDKAPAGYYNLPFGVDTKLSGFTYFGEIGSVDQYGYRPLPGSPLINAGFYYFHPIVGKSLQDQLHLPRSLNGMTDIGAIEALPDFVVRNTNADGPSSLATVVHDANYFSVPFTFEPSYFSTPRTIVLDKTLTLTNTNLIGPGAQLLTIRNKGDDTLIRFYANSTANTISGLTIGGQKGIHTCVDIPNSDFHNKISVLFRDVHFTGNGYDGTVPIPCGTLIDSNTDVIIERCVFDNNLTNGSIIHAYSRKVTIINSIVAKNISYPFHGAFTTEELFIYNSTIVNNSVGNKYGLASVEKFEIHSSVIAGTTAKPGFDNIELYGYGGSASGLVHNSLIGSTQGVVISGSGNLPSGTDAKLSGLIPNPTGMPIIVPLAGSPLINAGSNPLNLSEDLRGGPRVDGGKADIGAIETRTFVVINTSNAGAGSLRDAVTQANALPGPDTIAFDPAIFAPNKTIAFTTGELPLNESVTIIGSVNRVNLHANSLSRIFNTTGAPTGAIFHLSNLNLQYGSTSGSGGAMLIGDQQVSLSNASIMHSSAGGMGGAIRSTSSFPLTLTNVHIAHNTAGSDGGGIAAIGSGRVQVVTSTISGNSSGGTGGGIHFYTNNATQNLNINQSTLSSNIANSRGGGIYSQHNSIIIIYNSTFTLNKASQGGGIANISTGTIALESTIVSGNMAPTAADLSSPNKVTATYSAIGSSSGFTLSGASFGNLAYGANLKLGALANNGGPTPTHLPDLNSPVVNAGSNSQNFLTDQRGPGFTRLRNGIAEIGAVEAPTNLIVTNANDSGTGSLRQAVLDSNKSPGIDTISFSPTFLATAKTITLTTGQISIDDSVEIIGPGSGILTISGYNSSRIFNISSFYKSVHLQGVTLTKAINTAIMGIETNLSIHQAVITGNAGGAVRLASYFSGQGPYTAKLAITNSTVSANSAASGGALYLGSKTSLAITSSTLSGNTATGSIGGAIHFYGAVGAGGFAIINSTLSGNKASTRGGAIAFGGSAGTGGTISLRNITITANTGTNSGGIDRVGGVVTFSLESTILDNNFHGASLPSDLMTTGLVTANASALGPNTGGYFLLGTANLIDQNLKLNPLGNNGGSTLTHSFPSSSPLVNAGNNTLALSLDQRGLTRTIGFTTDIGAFELQGSPAIVEEVNINGGAMQRSRVTRLSGFFSEVVVTSAAAFEVRRLSDNKLVGLNVSFPPAAGQTAFEITFSGALTEHGSLADGRYRLTIFANKTSTYAGFLDGNGDGTGGDDYTLEFHRLFGDVDNNHTVDSNDFAAFGGAFGSTAPNTPFDFDNNSTTDISDFAAFGARFGVTL